LHARRGCPAREIFFVNSSRETSFGFEPHAAKAASCLASYGPPNPLARSAGGSEIAFSAQAAKAISWFDASAANLSSPRQYRFKHRLTVFFLASYGSPNPLAQSAERVRDYFCGLRRKSNLVV